MENLIEKILGLEGSLSFPVRELSAKQNITNTSSSYFEKKIPNTDHIILRLYL
ncbi:hypothetical protein [Nitrosopumilus sp.]|uniref:hypothetical protein n=1 Tax=Nitrosopumilus sp. TaxID=2024843 RepID=UPI00292D1B5E|nr:hypothetical protein [Nitrosopumilus sp.]